MSITAIRNTEPIEGYTVRQRIGSGGYGEVWKAEAPGGLEKAIKFVYGYLDEQRASREMKALNRIKEVRHPFLLSLERIEIVDGQLVIVTELADESLKDFYDKSRKSGETGIPRDKLLVLLGDAADALDYMCQSFSLQHLDIKPENLLLVGGRVKVADFGLVKDLHDASVSLMGGLTPLYAPPEVFNGRPSLQSDQYSLAVVYQEMLTGSLPFTGTTAAQLANQHLNSPPRLSPLPPADRPAIEKALSKNPSDRFENCRQLIDCLVRSGRGDNDQSIPVANKNGKSNGSAPNDRSTVARPATRPVTVQRSQPGGVKLPQPSARQAVKNAAPIEVASDQRLLHPTVLIGLGGTAGQVLSRWRRRLCERFGSTDAIPSIGMLAIDTDMKSLSRLTQGDSYSALDPNALVAAALRRPQDYRQRSDKLTQSISRRWLYNIPRSLQTEGLRPLGRLALLDHGDEVIKRIHEAIQAVTQSNSLSATEEATGFRLSSEPRVVLVSSISGGCGSGMVLDFAYLLRKVLADVGVAAYHTCGILTHSTPRNTEGRDLAVANAFACLTELQHYCRDDKNYPGDAACGLPSFDAATSPFDDTYVVHLGDDLNDEQFHAASDWLAEYLYLDSVTAGGSLFQACRSSNGEDNNNRLRTMGVCQVGCSDADRIATATELLCQQVLQRWRMQSDSTWDHSLATRTSQSRESTVSSESKQTSPIHGLCTRQCKELGLDFDSLVQSAHQIVEQGEGDDLQSWLRSVVAPFGEGSPAEGAAAAALAAIDARFGIRAGVENEQVSSTTDFDKNLEPLLSERAGAMGAAACDWLWTLLDEPEVRLRGAKCAVEWFVDHFSSLSKKSEEILSRLSREIDEIGQAVDKGNRKNKSTTDVRPLITQYFRLRMHRTAVAQLSRLTRPIEAQFKALDAQLAELGRELNHIADQFSGIAVDADLQEFASPLQQSLWQALQEQLPQLAVQVDRDFGVQFFGSNGGFRSLTDGEKNLRQSLPEALRRAARQALADARQQLNIIDSLVAHDGESHSPESVAKCLDAARPRLLECGGSKRLVLIAPEQSVSGDLQTLLQQQFDESVSVATDKDSDVVFCYEVGDLSLAHVAAELVDERTDYAEAASRLHARSDIDWSPW